MGNRGGEVSSRLALLVLLAVNRLVAQVSKPAVSPISKSAGRRNVGRVGLANGMRVWKPAIQQTGKSALRAGIATSRILCARSLFVGILALALLSGGCLTSPDRTLFTTNGPGWTVREGQVLWKPAGHHPELAGEIVLAQNVDGRATLQFTKTLLPVMLAQSATNRWLIQFPSQKLGFSGRGRPPQRFLWLYLPRALAGGALPEKISFTRKPDGSWRLANRQTGESLDGFLTP